MIYPSIDKLLTIVPSKYALVYIAANRSKEITKTNYCQMSKNEYKSVKPIGMALEEVYNNLIHVKMDR